MSQYRALVVDDERLARQDLRKLLEDFSEVEVLGEAADGEEALEKIKELDPGSPLPGYSNAGYFRF